MGSLTNLGKRVHKITRQIGDSGKWIDGEWVKADREVVDIYANIQPSLLAYQSKMLPESEREKESIAIFCNHWLYTARTGDTPLEADHIWYRGAYWKVLVARPYGNFGEHCEALAVRLNDSISERTTKEISKVDF